MDVKLILEEVAEVEQELMQALVEEVLEIALALELRLIVIMMIAMAMRQLVMGLMDVKSPLMQVVRWEVSQERTRTVALEEQGCV